MKQAIIPHFQFTNRLSDWTVTFMDYFRHKILCTLLYFLLLLYWFFFRLTVNKMSSYFLLNIESVITSRSSECLKKNRQCLQIKKSLLPKSSTHLKPVNEWQSKLHDVVAIMPLCIFYNTYYYNYFHDSLSKQRICIWYRGEHISVVASSKPVNEFRWKLNDFV